MNMRAQKSCLMKATKIRVNRISNPHSKICRAFNKTCRMSRFLKRIPANLKKTSRTTLTTAVLLLKSVFRKA